MARAIRARLDPRRERRRLTACMRELDANLCTLRVRKVDYPLERRDLRVRPEPRVLWRDAALRYDGSSFHRDAARAARRKALLAPIVTMLRCTPFREGMAYVRRCVRGASPSRVRCPNCTGTSATDGQSGNYISHYRPDSFRAPVTFKLYNSQRRYDSGMSPRELSGS